MRISSWRLAPARLGPVPLDPHPLTLPNSPGFPKTAEEARAYAHFIAAARSEKTPWRRIAEQLDISRIETIRLAYSLDDVLAEIEAPANTPSGPSVAQRSGAGESIAS